MRSVALKIKKLLLGILPALVFWIPAAFGLALELYNRYFRGLATPLTWISAGLILMSLIFLVRRRWLLWLLVLTNTLYLTIFATTGLWRLDLHPSLVYNYRDWWLHSPTGRLHLEKPLGPYPPASGPYVTCHFALNGWPGVINFQPSLCIGFDERLRLKMFLDDHETEDGWLREFQVNDFQISRKTLMGDPIDRGALRIAFVSKEKKLWPKFQIREMYQVFEKETEEGTRILESISRDGKGRLKTLTESSLPNLTVRDAFAVYSSEGFLVKIPRVTGKNFAFPGKIDVSPLLEYTLPERIQAGGSHVEN